MTEQNMYKVTDTQVICHIFVQGRMPQWSTSKLRIYSINKNKL